MNYETMLNEVLSQIDPSLDKREGSLIYNAIAPFIISILSMKTELSEILDLYLFDTSYGEYLTRLSSQFSVNRLEATKSVRKITFTSTDENPVNVKVGDRFLLNDIVFIVKEMTALNEGLVECKDKGEIGNKNGGIAISLQNINNLSKAEIGDVVIYGEEEETDDKLRNRLFLALAKNPSSGNMQYFQKIMSEISTVGRCKYEPFHNGGNTLKICILNSQQRKASEELIQSTQDIIDPLKHHGLGMGQAPLGIKVSIDTAVNKEITVKANVKLNEGFSDIEPIKKEVKKAIESYFDSIAFLKNSVSYLKTGAVILEDNQAIQDVLNLTLNELEENIELSEYEIPFLKELTLEVIE